MEDDDDAGGDEEEDKPLKYRCSKGKGWLKEKSEVRRNWNTGKGWWGNSKGSGQRKEELIKERYVKRKEDNSLKDDSENI